MAAPPPPPPPTTANTSDAPVPGGGPAPTAFSASFTSSSSPSLAVFQQPLRAYLGTHPEFDGIAVGACVFFFNNSDFPPSIVDVDVDEPRILLVQRAPTDSMPLLWEVPGGACDYEDETLLHAVARELWEEAGLKASRVVSRIEGPAGGTEDGGGLRDVFFTRRGRRMIKYSFLVEVESCEEVKLDPAEHVAYLWVTEEEARNKKCGDVEFKYTIPRQMEIVLEAFELKRRGI